MNNTVNNVVFNSMMLEKVHGNFVNSNKIKNDRDDIKEMSLSLEENAYNDELED